MKMKDIVVGEDYAESYNRVRVIEKAVHRQVWVASGRWGNYQNSQHADGVVVEFRNDKGEPVLDRDGSIRTKIVGTRAIDSTWAEKVQADHDKEIRTMAVRANVLSLKQEFEHGRKLANTIIEKPISEWAFHTDRYGRNEVHLDADQFITIMKILEVAAGLGETK